MIIVTEINRKSLIFAGVKQPMKQLVSTLLISLFLFSIARPVFPYFEYILNHEYIAKVLCINKEKPELKCDGKCYLKAQLKKVQPTNTPEEKRVPKIELEKFHIICYQAEAFQLKPLTFKEEMIVWELPFLINNPSFSPPTPPPQC